MRILVITTAHHPRYDCQALLYEYFAAHPGNEVTVVAPCSTDVTRGSQPLPVEEEYDGVHVRRIYRDIQEMWQRPDLKAVQFREAVEVSKPEIIWCWHEGNYPLAAYAHDISNAPIVLYLEFPTERILKRSRRDGVPVILSCVRTHRHIEDAMTWGDQYFLQVNAPAGVPGAEQYWKIEKVNRGIFVGSLGYGYKDPERFISLLPQLFERTPMEEFYLLSSGSEFPERIMRELGSRYRISYRQHATREEIFAEIARSYFSFTTMRGEWPGAFPCESWALKTPVYAAGGTMGGMIEDGVTGVTTLEGVCRLYRDRQLYEAIQHEGFAQYVEEYSTEAVGRRCLRVFEGLLNGSMRDVWEELRWKGEDASDARVGSTCAPRRPRKVVTFAPQGAKKLRIGLQIPKAGTFEGSVWGDEILAEGIADALNEFDIVDRACVYTPVTIHSNLDYVIDFCPFPESRYIAEAATVWWLQAGLLRAEDLQRIHLPLSLYDDFLAAGTKPAAWLQQNGVADPTVMLMGADLAIYRPLTPQQKYAHDIVFVGNNNRTPEQIENFLVPLVPLGLKVYGAGWETIPELQPALVGRIHPRQVPALYSSAKLVLSLHTAWHREMDVPTTRLWEALGCGAAVVSDPLPLASQVFGDLIVWSGGGTDLVEKVKYLLENAEVRRQFKARARLAALRIGGFEGHALTLLSRYGQLSDPEVRKARRMDRLLQHGQKFWESGEKDKAEECYRVALVLDPGSAEVQNNLATVLWDKGCRTEALQGFRKAVELDATHADALYNLVAACHELGAFSLLEEQLKRILQMYPQRAELLPILADVKIRQERFDEAKDLLQRCLDLDPGNREVREVLEHLDGTGPGAAGVVDSVRSTQTT